MYDTQVQDHWPRSAATRWSWHTSSNLLRRVINAAIAGETVKMLAGESNADEVDGDADEVDGDDFTASSMSPV